MSRRVWPEVSLHHNTLFTGQPSGWCLPFHTDYDDMIQESVREMNAEERAWLQRAMQPQSYEVRQVDTAEMWGPVVVVVLTFVVLALAGASWGGLAVAATAFAIVGSYKLVAARRRAARENAIRQKNLEAHAARRHAKLAGALEDGRVTVKRVHAVAVVEIEPIEDEGTGYVFDLGDSHVLFIKGSDYFPEDEEASWPNTDFEIVRTVAAGQLLDVYCHGTELPPLRVIPGKDVDPGKGWDEREEVLEISLEEAVRSILRNP
jgi:hypothetical protein